MDYIECNHCQKKYIINLEKIPKVSKKWRCVSCQKVQLYPYYSEQEQEFVLDVDLSCPNCQKKYKIPSSKFTSEKTKMVCASCKHRFESTLLNFENLQKLNQKITSYLNNDQPPIRPILKEDQEEFKDLVKKIIPEKEKKTPSPKENFTELDFEEKSNYSQQATLSENSKIENFNEWQNELHQKKGMVPKSQRSNLFLSETQEKKLDKSDLPSLQEEKQKVKNTSSKIIGLPFFFFTLFLVIVILYIYFLKV